MKQKALRSALHELKCLYIDIFDINCITELPEILNKKVENIVLNRNDADEISKQRELINQLESTIWKWHQDSPSSYNILICLATLSLFGFSLEKFCFETSPSVKDLENLSTILEDNFKELKSIEEKERKEAYVLDIALHNPFETYQVIRFLQATLPDAIFHKIPSSGAVDADLTKLREEVTHGLFGKDHKPTFKERQKSLSMHFYSIFSRKMRQSRKEENNVDIKPNVQRLLEDLDLMKYYPQKITYDDVIKISEDGCKETNEKPSTLKELPWYFMRRLIGLNSNIREKASVIGKKKETDNKVDELENDGRDDEVDFTWPTDSEEEEPKSQELKRRRLGKKKTCHLENSVHPLDLIYAIFLCADDFLRQELTDKMSKCQYAVPFILPSAIGNGDNTMSTEMGDESQTTVLHWGLQGISRTYWEENKQIVTKTLPKVECPLVTCLNFDVNSPWKSRLINKMLSPQQNTFWHEALEGGELEQKVSQGMVEVSWNLPAGRGNDEFEMPVTFANLRGDANQFPVVTETLSNLSTTTCIFTDKINKIVATFLERYFGKACLKNVILVILYDPDKEAKALMNSDRLRGNLKLEGFQVINCPLEESNFHTTYVNLKESLQTSFNRHADWKTSLRRFVNEVKLNSCLKVDDEACYQGYKAAQKILSDIDEIETGNIRSKILPSQSDDKTREQIGKHDKEICRQKDIAESDITQYVIKEEEEKWKLQWKQLQYPLSETFIHFLKNITNFSSLNRKYFLQSLKLGLNERSIEFLQPLYEKYQRCRLKKKCEETDTKLKKLNHELMCSSIGLEHFFREMAVMYENMNALREQVKSEDKFEGILSTLSKTMADILLEGEAIEILDGDVVYSPVIWLKAVLNKIENKENVRIFKVSALGAQSSGKSTLLNTVFGLNFPVSSGRCTRGAYMQLVKIDEKLSNRLRCDYLLVIDSEGLMSRVAKNEDYDNELATFVIGLSDLTLVVIKGEGNEMQDVLPIAIHVFLRMNVLGELQACHFVHQNMGAVDVKKTMPIEIDSFVQLLDEKTRAAAQEAWKKKYTRFTDVLHYDNTADNTYVCGLWDGTPPMGKTDMEYSKTMQKLKGNILERLEKVGKEKQYSTLEDFSKWLEDIWEAIKYENFVFSFRNVLAVEAYKRLSRILNDKEWEIKKTMREKMEAKKKEKKDKIMKENDKNTVKKTIDVLVETAIENVADYSDKLSTCIGHYFDCPGCQREDCSKEVKNRQFLRDYKGEFLRDIWRFMKELEEEMSQSAKNLEVETSLHQESAKMDSILKKNVKHLISKVNFDASLTYNKEQAFDEMWTTETDEILRKIPPRQQSESFIKKTVEKAIRDSLGSEVFKYNKKKTDKSTKADDTGFSIKRYHVNGGKKLAPYNLERLKRRTEAIVKRTGVHYRRLKKGREFEPRHAETLFKDVQNQIDGIKDKGIETTLDFSVDLMLYIEELAVRNFSWNQTEYEESSSAVGLLEKKKDAYHETFLIATGKGDPAVGFGNIISKLIQENLEDRITCMELLQVLRNNKGDIFRDAQALKTCSIVHLIGQNVQSGVNHFSFARYEEVIKETITENSISCLEEENCFKEHAMSKLQTVIEELKQVVQKTEASRCTGANFIEKLFSNMNGLKRPHYDIEAYKMVPVYDKFQFASTLKTELTGRIHKQLKESIESWDVTTIIERKGLMEFVFKEILGCPFCELQRSPCCFGLTNDGQRYLSLIQLIAENKQKELVAHRCNEDSNHVTIYAYIIRNSSIESEAYTSRVVKKILQLQKEFDMH